MSEKKVVLAVDDNLQQLSEYKSILIPDYDLRVVKSASEAIAFLIRSKSDIILLDIEMPNINGFEFLEDLKKTPVNQNTAIIIISGNTGEDFMAKAKQYNVDEVMQKPVKPEELITAIKKHIN